MKCSRIWWKTKSKLDFWEEQDWGQTPAVSAGERTEWRETKGSSGKQGFSFFFFFLCMSEPAGLPARGEKKTWTAIFDRSQVDKRPRTFLFPATLFLTLLSSIVWHWLGPEKKQKTKNITKHTQKTQPFASGRLGSPVAARSRRAGPISSRATSSAFKGVRCVRGGFVPRKKKTLFEERLVKISEGTGPFFPSLSPSACLVGGEFETPCRRGGWRSFISRSYHA